MPDDNTLFQSLEELGKSDIFSLHLLVLLITREITAALPESVQGQLMEMKTQLQKDIAAVVEKLQKLYVQETEQLCVKYKQEALEAVMNNEWKRKSLSILVCMYIFCKEKRIELKTYGGAIRASTYDWPEVRLPSNESMNEVTPWMDRKEDRQRG